MGVVEDIRKLLQDLVTPEMRALAEQVKNLDGKIDTLDRHVNGRIDALENNVAARFAVSDENINGKFESLRAEMTRRFDHMESTFRLDERVSLLEADRRKQKPSSH
jgi:hypothetical protein